ncbi:GAF domain-containing protein [Spirochaeta cellobiosiphila]|uniref:GAF domain-containing protein n=1 Tax=Spirochaeta cellobiosiphila TaxID=504483 RepID=UPI000490F54E|nr:GAF domain-containing protein [Spirochaeta cellobiosiphila]
MFSLQDNTDSDLNYDLLKKQTKALTEGIGSALANLSNISSLLYHALPMVNWVGFYLKPETSENLTLGPFQGKPACIEIPFGVGVCGTAVKEDKTMRIDDVHSFPGHIACDSDSRSELVIPIKIDNKIIGVLDIDSPQESRFTPEDQENMEDICMILREALKRGNIKSLINSI